MCVNQVGSAPTTQTPPATGDNVNVSNPFDDPVGAPPRGSPFPQGVPPGSYPPPPPGSRPPGTFLS